MITRVLAVSLAVAGVTAAQDKPLPGSERTVPVGEQKAPTLPSFDLPEFVITGRESIDLPVAEKRTLNDGSGSGVIERPSGTNTGRTGDDAPESNVRRVIGEDAGLHNARAYLGLGSFSTFLLGVQGSGTLEGVHADGEAEYWNTAGFDPNTDASLIRLNAGVRVPTTLLSGWLEGERVRAEGAFRRDLYRWYGTASPSQQRRVVSGSGSAGLSGYVRGGSLASLSLAYGGGSITDSSVSVSEGIFDAEGEYHQSLLGLPMSFTIRARSAGKSGGTGGSNGGAVATVGVQWSPVEHLKTRFSLGVGTVSGEAGQSETVLLPGFSAEFRINQDHRFFGSYAPGIGFNDLVSLVRRAPFLSASQPVLHTIVRNSGAFGIHSDWTGSVSSTVELVTSKSSFYPVVADTGGGYYAVVYGDIRETFVRTSVVAKLPANHYFSAIAIIRSSKSSTSGRSVPYLPSSEVRLSYRNVLTEQLEAEGTVQFVSAREATVTGLSRSVSAYARADARVTYAALPGFKVWAEIRNLLNSTIEHWSGYREAPFGVNIGLSYAM